MTFTGKASSLDELDYETHRRLQYRLLGIDPEAPNEQRDQEILGFHLKQAQEQHALAVFNPLRDWIVKAITIAEQLSNNNAQYYMRYGIGRRYSMVWYAYRTIMFGASPVREDPLSHADQQELSHAINVIYMNLRGILDNFAWCFLYEKESAEADRISNLDVDLFKHHGFISWPALQRLQKS